jgi:hypothetical protein
MARMKLTARKHVRVPPCRNVVPTKSHNDGQDAGYFPRTLQTVLLALGSSEPPLFIGTLRLLCGNSYLWRVHVVIYKRSTTDRIHRIRQVVEAAALRWTFEAGMREAACGALAILRHEAYERMAHSQYCHFPSRAEEGAEAVILPARAHDRMGCFTDQVKLTRALVLDLDEAVKEVKLLGEHEELSQKITELEALCKKLREDTQRLEEEKATLEEMVESHDELLMEIAREMGLDRMGEDEDEEDEEEDADDGGDVAAPPAAATPPPVPLLPCMRRSMKKARWRRSLKKKPQYCMR